MTVLLTSNIVRMCNRVTKPVAVFLCAPGGLNEKRAEMKAE